MHPDDKSRYTLAFGADGVVNARIDCNRGRGGWKSAHKGQLDQLVKQLPYVRSYVIREGKLFLSLMADGGTYEFESR